MIHVVVHKNVSLKIFTSYYKLLNFFLYYIIEQYIIMNNNIYYLVLNRTFN